MRRATLVVSAALFLALAAPSVWAQQEPAGERGEKGAAARSEGEGGDGLELWAWANLVLLAGGLIWVFRKNAVTFVVQRASGIRNGMVEDDEPGSGAERRI